MRRWNGWGDPQTTYPLSESAAEYLAQQLGAGIAPADLEFDQALRLVPPSRLPEHPLIDRSPAARLWHARGQSFPDWVALRSGFQLSFPDGVAYPQNEADLRQLIALGVQLQLRLIPYGGGTSVVGHINPLPGERPTLTIDLSRLNQLLDLDTVSRLATFQAGVSGPQLEQALRLQGYTLGHFPQSFELSTLGGWIATRSSGQQSYYYGRIEDLFAGGHLESPAGPLDLPPLPASAAGPDLRQLVLGSEGRLGILTQAQVRIRPLPEFEAFYGVFFHEWEAGMQAVREVAQRGLPISMARLSNPLETESTLRLSGKDRLVAWAEAGLRLAGFGPQRCLLIWGLTGSARWCARVRTAAQQIFRRHGGLFTGTLIGHTWLRSRFLTPYLRNTLWERGYAVDTLETAVPWSAVADTAARLLDTLRHGLERWNERVMAFVHLSHIYPDGASIYVTYLFRRASSPEETLARWQTLKAAASQVIVEQRGTISHQHGVGTDHAPYLAAEKGALGMQALQQVARSFDPDGIMNPGKAWG